MRTTPFTLVFGQIAAERFPAIREALRTEGGEGGEGSAPADRARFVLVEPVARLLRDIVPEAAGAEALEAHLLLLHHAYLHWAGEGWVYDISEDALQRAMSDHRITSRPPRAALYLQLPELRVWGSSTPGAAAEPLDGMFVSETTTPGRIAVLAVFGMRPDRPGFSAVGLDGGADAEDASSGEIEVAAAREDGSAPFGPMLAGGSAAGLHSVANAGELLLLTCRILAQLPETDDGAVRQGGALERVVHVE
ncbi:MAG TPA: hypothetical protein VG454_16480 [Gemmatimonadales bacterium]|nr:hypothetical protein [Gemmatimonadales bacterium]